MYPSATEARRAVRGIRWRAGHRWAEPDLGTGDVKSAGIRGEHGERDRVPGIVLQCLGIADIF